MKGGEQSNKLECRVKQVSETRGAVKSVLGQLRKGENETRGGSSREKDVKIRHKTNVIDARWRCGTDNQRQQEAGML